MGDGVLIGAIVVHHPDFFGVLAEDFDVEDFGFGNAGDTAAETQDDFVGKLMGDLAGMLKAAEKDIVDSPVSAAHLGELVGLIVRGELTGNLAKSVLTKMFESGEAPAIIVSAKV